MSKTKPLTVNSMLRRTPASVKKQVARMEKAKARSRRRGQKATYTLAELKAFSDLAGALTARIQDKTSCSRRGEWRVAAAGSPFITYKDPTEWPESMYEPLKCD